MSALTHVSRNAAQAALRAAIASLLPSLSWRHHGIGVLQGYVSEDVDPEVRVHIWSRRLVKPGMDESGAIHDHRFDLVSHVLAGTVLHEEVFAAEDPNGDHTTLRLTHARAAADTKYHGPTAPIGDLLSVRRNLIVVPAGLTYSFPAGHFHRSPVASDSVAVTCVEKHGQRDVSARILHPINVPPVMAFGHDMDYGLVAELVSEAAGALSRSP